MFSWLAKEILTRNMARLREGDYRPLLRLDAKDIRFRFPGDSSWATEIYGRDDLERWLQRFVATGLKIYPDEVIAQGPPWRMTLCVRGTDHLDTEDGRVYENRYVIWGRMSWGLLREYEVYEDTQASKGLDEHMASRGAGRAPDPTTPATLYEWAGGEPALAAMIAAFYDRVEADEELSGLFPGGVSEEHRQHVIAWWCEVFGGPARYTEELGGYEHMLARHRGLAITPEQRFRFASLISLAADDAGLPDDPEFRSALVAYVEWGTRLAMHNSAPGADAVEHAPVPRWGWGEAPPYQQP